MKVFWIGLIVGLAFAAASICGVTMYLINRLIVRSPDRAIEVIQKLSDYGDNLDVVVLEERGKNFAQFRKYVREDGDWGVDFVFPLVGKNSHASVNLEEMAQKFMLPIVKRPTPFGWEYLFLQLSRNGEVIPEVASACFSASGITFEEPLGIGSGSTLNWTRKSKVFDKVSNVSDHSDRYDVTNFEV